MFDYSSKTNSLTFFCFSDHARDNWKVSLKCDEPFSRYEYLYQILDLVQLVQLGPSPNSVTIILIQLTSYHQNIYNSKIDYIKK